MTARRNTDRAGRAARRLGPLLLLAPLATIACQPASTPGEGKGSNTALASPKQQVAPGDLPDCAGPGPARGKLRQGEQSAADRITEASQLVGRGPDKLELWKTPHGEFWVLPGEFDTLAWVLAEQEFGIYDGGETAGVRSGDVVLDCGAHYGGYTRKALDQGAGLVVAIELAPDNLVCLRKSFAKEIAQGMVIVYPKGVWHQDDQLALERAEKSWANRVEEGNRSGLLVPLTTVDKIVAELKLERVDFIKMDIEGSERQALAGAAGTLRRFKPRMAIAAYHGGDDLAVLPATALDAQPRYEICVWGRNGGWGNRTLFFR
jgi:FkbM family methyltransferase